MDEINIVGMGEFPIFYAYCESNGVLVNKCATSDKLKVLPCKDLECGHFISRRHMSAHIHLHTADGYAHRGYRVPII